MLRQLHSIPGLIFGFVLLVLATSGAILSIDPALERLAAPATTGISVAQIAATVSAQYPTVERIDRRANGVIVVSYQGADGNFVSERIDPKTGTALAVETHSPVMLWIKNLHRSFLLDDAGRAVAGASAGVMALMALTGLLLLVAALGGWMRLSGRVRATGANRWHAIAGRFAVSMLVVSALTGGYMSLVNFGYVDDGTSVEPDFPFEVAGGAPSPVADLAALQSVPLADLRRLTFPVPRDATDVFGLQTATGSGYVDQQTGQMLTWLDYSTLQNVWEFIYMLHTGQGLWWFGLILGAGALTVPLLSVTGMLIWLGRRRARPHVPGTVSAAQADVVVLVGSEGGTTWGFAATLIAGLQAAGRKVHLGAMNDLRAYDRAQALILLAATYGDGVAPASARNFLDRLAALNTKLPPTAVLGFGDRMFAQFCGYASTVTEALAAINTPQLLAPDQIDRQSSMDFASWGRALGAALGIPLELDHRAALPPIISLKLISRQDFGAEVQAPAAIFRFGPVTPPRWFGSRWFGNGLPRFAAGDLLGILAPGSDLPRLYSLASSRADGMVEIAVRKMPGGLCSGHLHGLQPGDTVQAFVRPNPAFRPQSGKAPVILVAAGCGVGPMAGFLRRNPKSREMSLYFGARDPQSDFLYQADFAKWQAEGRLSRLITAFSRVRDRAYVQDRLRADAQALRDQIARGGQVLVCGGTAMARAVAGEFEALLAPLGLTVATLKAEGRYLEDVY